MMKQPNGFTPGQLKKVGVTLLSAKLSKLRCDKCSESWKVEQRGLNLPKGYWRCPNGCNKASGAAD